MDKDEQKTKLWEIINNLIRDEEFKDFTIEQITRTGITLLNQHMDSWSEGYRQGVIDYRKGVGQVEKKKE